MENKLIYETNNFIVEAVVQPHVDRKDGGHIKITPKVRLVDRTELSPELGKELMWLTIVTGKAMAIGMNNRGIDIGRINYQDNGNWSVFSPQGPYLHYHLYGRAKSARINKYGDACHFPHRETGFYDNFNPLDDEDIKEIQKQLKIVLKKDKYKKESWVE